MQSEEDLYKLIGENIFYFRLINRITSQELADKIKEKKGAQIATLALQAFEVGNELMEIGTLLGIADSLEVSPDRLMQKASFGDFVNGFGKNELEAVIFSTGKTTKED